MTSLDTKLAWDWQTKGTGILDRNLILFIPRVNYTDAAAHNDVTLLASDWSMKAILACDWLLLLRMWSQLQSEVLSTTRGRGLVFTYLYFWYKEQLSNIRTITPSLIYPHLSRHRYCSRRRAAPILKLHSINLELVLIDSERKTEKEASLFLQSKV